MPARPRFTIAVATTFAIGLTALATAADQDLSTVEGRFAHVTSKLDTGGVYYHYIDLEGVADQYYEAAEGFLSAILENVEEPEMQEGMRVLLEKGGPIYRYLGFSAIQGFGSSSVPEGDGYLTRSFLALDRERLGDRPLFASGEPRAREGLHLAPKETQFFLSADASPRNAVQMLYDIAAITHPAEAASQIDQGFEMAQAFTTVPWKQALQSLDGEMVVAVWADGNEWQTIEGPDKPLAVPKFHYLVALQTSDSSLADGLINWAQMQTFEVETLVAGDVTISTLVPPNFLERAPRVSIARDETFTYFASGTGVLTDALARLGDGSGGLVDSAEFQQMRAGFPQECNSIIFFDKAAEKTFEEMARRNTADEPSVQRMMESMKEFAESIATPMSTMAVTVHEPDGISWYSRSSNSARSKGAMVAAASAGIMVAVAVPGFLRAREISRRNACQENQAKLDGALQQYMLENRIETRAEAIERVGSSQSTPADGAWVGSLIGPNLYLRFEPVCPAGGVYTYNDTDAHPELPPVSCSLSHQPGVAPQFWHEFPGH